MIVLTAEEALAASTGIRTSRMRPSNSPIDQLEVGNGRVLLEELRIDDCRQNDLYSSGVSVVSTTSMG